MSYSRTKSYIKNESVAGILLFLSAMIALIISNTELNDEYIHLINLPISITVGDFSLNKPLIKWVNDGLMALFFLGLTLETKFHFLEGEFIDKSSLSLAGIAAIGGAVMPALLYYCLTFSDPVSVKGWAIPIATDTAFVLALLSFLPKKIPFSARVFILGLSIIDDIIAILVLVFFYTPNLYFVPLLVAVFFIIALCILNLLNISKITPYMLIGIGLWLAFIEAGIHGTISGIFLGLAVPLRADLEEHYSHSPLKKLEHNLYPLVTFVTLPLFGFLNTEISFKEIAFSDLSSLIAMGIIFSLFIGKPLGILLSSYLFIKLKFGKMPNGLNWPKFFIISMLCGIGFTFSIFIGLLSFEDPHLINQMKIGVIIGSLLSAFVGGMILVCTSSPTHIDP